VYIKLNIRYISFALFLFIITALSAQEIIMEISPNPVGRGDRFNIDFYIDHENMSEISIESPSFPDGIILYKGPYIRPYWLQLPDGSSKKKTLITYTYSTSSEGRFEIGAFKIKLGDSAYETDPNIIRVGLYKNRKLYMPFDVQWSFSSNQLYVGQAIPIVLEVKNLEEVMIFNDISVSLPEKGFLESVKNLGQVSITDIGDLSLFTIPVRGFIFTPSSSGRIKTPLASVSARGINSVSQASNFDVLKIPSEIKDTGAIGSFKVSSWLNNDIIRRNENIELHLKVEGIGNLNYFQLQIPFGEGLALVNTSEITDYISTNKGYSGSRETIYSFISDSSGDKEIVIPPFPFLNPETGFINKGRIQSFYLQIDSELNEIIDENAAEIFPFHPKKADSGGFSSTSRYKDPSSYLWMLPGPLIFLIFLISGKKKIILGASIIFIAASGQVKTVSNVDIAIGQYEMGEYSNAIESLNKARNELNDNSYISYNLALAYYQTGDFGRSVYEARNAYYHDPLNSDYRDLVTYIEIKGGINYPIELSFNLYPDVFLFLLMILVNFAAFTGVIYLVKNKNIYFITSVLLISLGVLTFMGLGFSIVQKGRQVGVIIQDPVFVKKIPQQEAETILSMKPGESVIIKGESDNYLFINTGTGMKGWVEKSNLMILKE
jgi:tetratricopeptide (TPR) repeat protein